MSDVIDSGERTTRKPHTCAYCVLPIPIGTTVHWWTWTDAGKAETSYAHGECQDAAHWEAAEFGLNEDEMPDPDTFRRETLPEYRAVRAAARAATTAAGGGQHG